MADGVLHKLNHYISHHLLIKIIYSIAYPHLLYGIELDNASNIYIDAVQKQKNLLSKFYLCIVLLE